jgi:hypothetical protein
MYSWPRTLLPCLFVSTPRPALTRRANSATATRAATRWRLLESGKYALTGNVTDQITLRDIRTGRRYYASVPALPAFYLAGFRRGVRVLEDHEFELVLVSKDD